MEDILLKVRVRRKIDGREWDVAEQTGTSPFIQTKYTQLAHNVDSTFLNRSF